MNEPLKKVERSLENQVGRMTQKANNKFHQELETIIDRVVTNKQMESTVLLAVERVLLSLGKRYWRHLILFGLGALILQAIVLGVTVATMHQVL